MSLEATLAISWFAGTLESSTRRGGLDKLEKPKWLDGDDTWLFLLEIFSLTLLTSKLDISSGRLLIY